MGKMFYAVLICAVILSFGQCSIMQKVEVDTISNTTELIEKWKFFQSKIESTLESVLRQFLPLVLRAGADIGLSDKCYDSMTKFIFGIRQLKPWALKMIDAMGKPSSGILDGSLTAVGAYDQCLDIEVDPDQEDGFRGQYCSINFRPPLPPKPYFYRMDQELEALKNFTASNPIVQEIKSQAASFYLVAFRFGLCVPSACSIEDISKFGQIATKHIGLNARVTNCHSKTDIVFETDQIVVLCVIIMFVAVVAVATVLHIYMYEDVMDISKSSKLSWQLVRSFSIPYNIPRILDTRIPPEAVSLQCLHGMKFLSITWILLGHSYLYVNWQSFSFLKNAQRYGRDLAFQTIISASVAVDTFFFITGVLLSNITVKLVDKYGIESFNIPIYFARRIWRLIPVALLSVGLVILTPLYGSGPFWHEVMDDFVNTCRLNWWAIALSINNFLHPRNMCLQQTWYISCDVQLYIFSLFLLWLLFKSKKLGFSMVGFMIVISIIAPGVITFIFKYPPTMLLPNADIDQRLEMWHHSYFLPYAHSGPYGIGLLLGYFLAKNKKITLPLKVRILGWLIAIGFSTSILYSTVKWNRPNVPTTSESVSYAALHRTGWAMAIAWLTLMCSTGYGGFINSILSWKALIPFSRLTYLIYLLHFVIMWSQTASFRSTVDASHAIGVWYWFANMVATVLLSFAVKVFFDSPLQELEKIFLSRLIAKKTPEILKGEKNQVSVENAPETNRFKYENDSVISKNTRL